MRIRFINPARASMLPSLMEIAEVAAYRQHGIKADGRRIYPSVFEISFTAFDSNPSEDSEYGFYTLSKPIRNAEEEERAEQTYQSILSSLGLNGYANLVAGEMTSLIGSGWTWKKT